MGIVSWVVLGASAAFLAKMVIGGADEVLITVVLGIVGAIVGGFMASAIFNKGDVTGVTIESVVMSLLGATLVLLEWGALIETRLGSLETDDQAETMVESTTVVKHREQ